MKLHRLRLFMRTSFRRVPAVLASSATIALLLSPFALSESAMVTPNIADAAPLTSSIASASTSTKKGSVIKTKNQAMVPPPPPPPSIHPAPSMITPGSPYPARLIVPSIGLNVPIQGVGVNSAGEMAVPSGGSGAVGWYQGGTIPGHGGTAVLDAHVFAAFSKLNKLAVGSDIYVQTKGGEELHFVVRAAQTYALSEISSNMLFGSDGSSRLNLITCAGKLTADHSTYDHRLVVYAALVS